MHNPILVILAGGASSRMWPLREKSLLRFGDEPLLLAQLHRYKSMGFTQAVIVGTVSYTHLMCIRDRAWAAWYGLARPRQKFWGA